MKPKTPANAMMPLQHAVLMPSHLRETCQTLKAHKRGYHRREWGGQRLRVPGAHHPAVMQRIPPPCPCRDRDAPGRIACNFRGKAAKPDGRGPQGEIRTRSTVPNRDTALSIPLFGVKGQGKGGRPTLTRFVQQSFFNS